MELSVNAEVLNVVTDKRVVRIPSTLCSRPNTTYHLSSRGHMQDGMLFVKAKRHYESSENRL
uniref:Uncharacterized protein n=1 Tax=Ascaris lumbricoides TaxID=6252 RepID=A0A0M3IUX3_ASCLU